MDKTIKVAAQKLLDLAASIEKEASEKTFFVCEGCNHTASLGEINQKRKAVAASMNIDKVADVTVNERISCPACDGEMSYVATEDSSKYYLESDDEDALPGEPLVEEEKKPVLPGLEEEKPEEKSTFEPVDEQKDDDELDLSFGEEDTDEEPEEDSGVVEETVTEEMPEEMSEEKPKPDKPDDKKAKYPKKPVPKFEKMPKDASEEMQQAIMKYASCIH